MDFNIKSLLRIKHFFRWFHNCGYKLLLETNVNVTITTNFAGDCTDVNPNNPQSTEATGTIEAGESQICDISNNYLTFLLPQP
jgi:hypothetical protein